MSHFRRQSGLTGGSQKNLISWSQTLHWIHRKVLFTWMDILFFLPAHKLFTKMLANRYAIHSLHLLYSIANTPLWNRFLEARISNDSNILTKVNGRYWCKAESCSVLVILSSFIFNHLYNEKNCGPFHPSICDTLHDDIWHRESCDITISPVRCDVTLQAHFRCCCCFDCLVGFNSVLTFVVDDVGETTL